MMDAVFSVDVENDLYSKDYKGIEEGLPKLLGILEKQDIKATFFVTAQALKKYKNIFKNLKKKGHEIEVHSYNHKRYDIMNTKEKDMDLKETIKVYKKLFKANPKGFRAPQHSADKETLFLLQKYNFKYDSSRCPGNIMLFRHFFKKNSNKIELLKTFFSKLKPYKIIPGLVEIPRASFLISTGAFELKVYPLIFHKLIVLLFRKLKIPLVFVMHSWDMINIPKSKITKFCSKEKFQEKLNSFLEFSAKRLNYTTMEKLYEKIKK